MIAPNIGGLAQRLTDDLQGGADPCVVARAPGRMLTLFDCGQEAMAADVLSDVLRTVRLTGATFFDVVAKAPWAVESPPRERILPEILPGAEHLIAYHVVTEGRCFATVRGGESIPVEAGEVIVFTKGDPHVMSSDPGMPPDSAPPISSRQPPPAGCRCSATPRWPSASSGPRRN